MWPEPTGSPKGWRISADRLPVLAAVFCGAALVVCLLCALFLYRCCIMPRRDKHYCFRQSEGNSSGTQVPPVISPAYASQSAVYAEPKNQSRWNYNSRVVSSTPVNPWFKRMTEDVSCTQCSGVCPVPRSSSHPGPSQIPPQCSVKKQRPVSQPLQLGIPQLNGEIVPKSTMPEISEFSPQNVQYASSSILDEVTQDCGSGEEPTLKTRSLPAWVRSRPRPLSTEDDLNDLYAKVNFSKKRKNRMRNDEAAIIALSKSRSQFLHKDTDSLVNNEAVIVYDERTAL